MIPSRHNIISSLSNSDSFFIVNLLSRNADLISAAQAEEIRRAAGPETGAYAARGYLVDPEEEQRRYRSAYLDFLDRRDSGEIQLFFVPTYSCNFACSYCYQGGYEHQREAAALRPELIEAFYAAVDTSFAGRDKYVTIFGGEPLLPSAAARDNIRLLLEGARRRSLDVALVTNGYHLQDYLDSLGGARIREIQVTLDGPEAVHDRRRPLTGGGASFRRIVAGIDGALERNMPVNLRVVLDRENIAELPALAGFAADRGWSGHRLFKTQLGRNYSLHGCQSGRQHLFSRLELYRALSGLIAGHPELLSFHRPAYSVAGFLFENGELPDPLFDACPGCSGEWAFDTSGNIYPCTALVGKRGEEVGSYFPRLSYRSGAVAAWEERDVTSIPECAGCSVRLACGGGCAALAKQQTGKLAAPDCRPVKELLELGLSTYFAEEIQHVH